MDMRQLAALCVATITPAIDMKMVCSQCGEDILQETGWTKHKEQCHGEATA